MRGVAGKQNNAPGPRSGQRTVRRRQDAAERQERRAQLSPQQQLAELDARLGVDVGAQKERARLHVQIRRAS